MTPGEHLAYAELLDHAMHLACRCQTLLSGCRDADGHIIANEARLRLEVERELRLLERLAPAIHALSPQP